ncbi:MAG: serpin family protein [Bacteroidales bacterium]
MKRFSISIILLLIITILISTCLKSDDLVMEPVFIQLNQKSKMLVNASNQFGFDLFQNMVAFRKSSSTNILVSPLSVFYALSMAANGANNSTKDDIYEVLKIESFSENDLNINNKQISNALLALDKNVEFSIANSIWYQSGINVLPGFISKNQDLYSAQMQAINFNDSTSFDKINQWVSDNTNHKIESIINQLNPDAKMYLLNAIYFKGTWKYEFDPAKNINRNFTLANGNEVSTQFMVQTANYKYKNYNELQLVEIPYGQGNWVMDLILPQPVLNTDQLLESYLGQNWDSLVNTPFNQETITIQMPLFNFDFEASLNEILISMGMESAFTPGVADFSMISEQQELFISEVKHKTYIEVDEKGTEAAAVTSVEISNGGADDRKVLVFDKPFVFVIREVSTGIILFIGKLENP